MDPVKPWHGANYPRDLGFSSPISDALLLLLLSELRGRAAARREELWVCRGAGGEGDRANLWWSAPRILRDRGILDPG